MFSFPHIQRPEEIFWVHGTAFSCIGPVCMREDSNSKKKPIKYHFNQEKHVGRCQGPDVPQDSCEGAVLPLGEGFGPPTLRGEEESISKDRDSHEALQATRCKLKHRTPGIRLSSALPVKHTQLRKFMACFCSWRKQLWLGGGL